MDIQKYLSGMLNYNPNIDWAEIKSLMQWYAYSNEWNRQVAGEAIPKSMPEPMSDARCTHSSRYRTTT